MCGGGVVWGGGPPHPPDTGTGRPPVSPDLPETGPGEGPPGRLLYRGEVIIQGVGYYTGGRLLYRG